MISSVDLFAVAGDGIRRESSAAALSRAVSTLYYSLFHALLETARSRVAECTNEKLLQHYIASFDHIALKDVALQVGAAAEPSLRKKLKGGSLAPWTTLLTKHPTDEDRRQPSAELLTLCETFAKMQQLRHQADYHPEWAVTFEEAERYQEEVGNALSAWRSIQNTDEAIVFLFAALGILKFR